MFSEECQKLVQIPTCEGETDDLQKEPTEPVDNRQNNTEQSERCVLIVRMNYRTAYVDYRNIQNAIVICTSFLYQDQALHEVDRQKW